MRFRNQIPRLFLAGNHGSGRHASKVLMIQYIGNDLPLSALPRQYAHLAAVPSGLPPEAGLGVVDGLWFLVLGLEDSNCMRI